MKRTLAVLLVSGLAVACGAGPREVAGAHDVLFVGSPAELASVSGADGSLLALAPGGIASRDGSTLFRTVAGSVDGSRLEALDPATGAQRWVTPVDPAVSPRVSTEHGSVVVLGPARTPVDPAYLAPGREHTPLVVVDRAGERTRRLDLAGNFEPEAFSLDGESLFVLEYTPALAPDRYRVRRLELASGAIEDVFSPDKELQTDMRGTARTQVFSPDGRRLYTLYNLAGQKAFVHTLSLDEKWAHCVDLAPPIGLGPEGSTALAIAPDGARLYVVDRLNAELTEIDTRALAIARRAPMPVAAAVGRTVAAVAESGAELYVGDENGLLTIASRDLTVSPDGGVPGPVGGLHAGAGALWIARNDHLDVVRGGRVIRTVLVPGLAGAIDRLGLASPTLSPERQAFQCAC